MMFLGCPFSPINLYNCQGVHYLKLNMKSTSINYQKSMSKFFGSRTSFSGQKYGILLALGGKFEFLIGSKYLAVTGFLI